MFLTLKKKQKENEREIESERASEREEYKNKENLANRKNEIRKATSNFCQRRSVFSRDFIILHSRT